MCEPAGDKFFLKFGSRPGASQSPRTTGVRSAWTEVSKWPFCLTRGFCAGLHGLDLQKTAEKPKTRVLNVARLSLSNTSPVAWQQATR